MIKFFGIPYIRGMAKIKGLEKSQFTLSKSKPWLFKDCAFLIEFSFISRLIDYKGFSQEAKRQK